MTVDDLLLADPVLLIEPRHHRILKKMSRPTLYRWLHTGKIVAFQLGKKWLTTESCINDFLKSSSQKTPDNSAFLRHRLRQVQAAEARYAAMRPRS